MTRNILYTITMLTAVLTWVAATHAQDPIQPGAEPVPAAEPGILQAAPADAQPVTPQHAAPEQINPGVPVHVAQGDAGCVGGNCQRPGGRPDLFYNYYASPQCNGVPNRMYIAPLPVPAHVGHVYYTYQPLYPHEMLYKHKRTYCTPYDGGRGVTKTHVRWW